MNTMSFQEYYNLVSAAVDLSRINASTKEINEEILASYNSNISVNDCIAEMKYLIDDAQSEDRYFYDELHDEILGGDEYDFLTV